LKGSIVITRIYHWSALLLAFFFALLATGVQAGPKDVPFRATLTVQEQIVPDAGCHFSGLGGTLTGSGTATHLGAVTLSASHCSIPTHGGSVAISRGTLTFTAANGDILYAEYIGTLSPLPDASGTYTFVGNYVVTGGTGRFEDAAGDGLLAGTFSGSLATRFFTGSITAEGRIGY
jgi:hypothetical protein